MTKRIKPFTPSRALEEIAVEHFPEVISTKIEKIREAINELKHEAASWGVIREFTPDGRFLGDIGELIAKLFFGVTLTLKQEKGHDAREAEVDGEATDKKGRTVEVKLRSRSTNIDFTGKPDVILVIYVSPVSLKWGVVCNGIGEDLLKDATPLPNGKFRTGCTKLMKAQKVQKLPPALIQIKPVKPLV
jgi:hypothetical protein